MGKVSAICGARWPLHRSRSVGAEGSFTRCTVSTAAMAGVNGSGDPGATTRKDFPQFPGEDFLAHAGTQYWESVETSLISRGLLAVAQGYNAPGVEHIVDEGSVPYDPQTNGSAESGVRLIKGGL